MIHLTHKIIRTLPKIISGFLVVAFVATLNGNFGDSFPNNIFAPKIAEAAFNKEINYQGKLTNTSNVAVADGNYIMKFRLYTSATGATTTNIWEEIRTAAGDKAAVSNGLFSVLLGSSTPLTTVDFNQTLYLGVEVCGTVGLSGCDNEMTPRKELGAVPAAFEADRIDGLSSEQFLRSDAVNSTSTATTFLTFTQNGAGKIAEFVGPNSVPVFSLLSGGNVGVGTTSPWAKFSINTFTSDTGGQPSFVIASSTATATTTQFIVTNTGDVGVGTTSPFARLSIQGSNGVGNVDVPLALAVYGGNGATGGSAGRGGGIVLQGGVGGALPMAGYAGSGGNVEIIGGTGGAGDGEFASGGFGGDIYLLPGSKGANAQVSTTDGDILLGVGASGTVRGNVGVGTTSPYAKLSVVGQVVGAYFTATTTTASTFPYASTTGLTVSGTGGLYVGTLTGPLQAIAGAVTASSTISVAYGGTGLSSAPSYGDLLVGNSSGGYTLTATSSLGIAFANIVGTLGVSQGGTGAATFGQGWIFSSGGTGALSASTSPTVNYLTSTSTTATSTFAYDTSIDGRLKVIQSGTSATIIGDTTGNARGTSALDIQSTRGIATQVASGAGSVAIGVSNVSSGEAGLAFGISNSSVALNAITFGNRNFSASDGYASVVMGILNNQTGGVLDFTTGAITGAALSSISVGRLSSAVGLLNTVTGNFGQAFGFNNTVSGVGSSAFGSFITNSIASSTQIGSGDTSKITIRGDTGFEGFTGIGTTTPVWMLSSYSATAPQLALSASAGVSQWTFRNAGGNLYFATTTTAGTATSSMPALTIINSTANVGIGTNSPSNKLEVHGNLGLSSGSKILDVTNNAKFILLEDGSGYTKLQQYTGYDFTAYDGVTYSSQLKTSATANQSSGTYTTIALTPTIRQSGTAGYTALKLNVTEVSTGSGSKLLQDLQVGGTSQFNVSNAGVVGIGTTSPYAKLSVVGPVVAEYFHATSTTATSTIAGGFTATGLVGFGTTTSDARVEIDSGGTSLVGLSVFGNTAANQDILRIYSGAGVLKSRFSAQGDLTGFARMYNTDSDVYQGFAIASNRSYAFTSGASTATRDAGISRLAASKLAVGNATNGDVSGTLIAAGIGVGSTTPWRTLSVTGTVALNGLTSSGTGNAVCIATSKDITDAGGGTCTPSSLRFKENVKTLDEGFAIDTLNQLRVVSFDYKKGAYSPEDKKESYGLIAEEVERIDPSLVDYGYDGKPLTLKFEKILGLAVQAIQEMGRERAFGQSGSGGSGGGGVGLAMDSILENLKNLGADIAEGLAYFKGLIAETLTVGSPEKPTGITLYDEVTGKPYCVKISNGKLKNISGKCEDVSEPTDGPKGGSASLSGSGSASSALPALASEPSFDSEPSEVEESVGEAVTSQEPRNEPEGESVSESEPQSKPESMSASESPSSPGSSS